MTTADDGPLIHFGKHPPAITAGDTHTHVWKDWVNLSAGQAIQRCFICGLRWHA